MGKFLCQRSVINYRKSMNLLKKLNHKMDITLSSTITCQHFGHKKEDGMPRDGCRYFNKSVHGETTIKPKAGYHIVYSYATVSPTSVRGKIIDVPTKSLQ